MRIPFSIKVSRNTKNNHKGQSLALVVDIKKGLEEEYLDDSKIPGDSLLRSYGRKEVHYLKRDGENIEVINPEMKIIPGETPSDLYEALVCSDVEIVFGAEATPWYKSKNIPYIIVIGIGVLLLFMMVGGGGGFG